MTAKEVLHGRIELLTEKEAEELLAQIEWEATEEEELTPEELAAAEAGFAEIERGESVDGEKLLRRLDLWNTD
jgi:predicted transcriptional regulator